MQDFNTAHDLHFERPSKKKSIKRSNIEYLFLEFIKRVASKKKERKKEENYLMDGLSYCQYVLNVHKWTTKRNDSMSIQSNLSAKKKYINKFKHLYSFSSSSHSIYSVYVRKELYWFEIQFQTFIHNSLSTIHKLNFQLIALFFYFIQFDHISSKIFNFTNDNKWLYMYISFYNRKWILLHQIDCFVLYTCIWIIYRI